MRLLTCKPCGKTVESSATGNVGKIQTETGWLWIMDGNGGSNWLCPDCFGKARAAMLEVVKWCPYPYAHYSMLLR